MSGQSIFQVIKSVLAAFVGVQSDKNRQSDFEQGSMTAYIFAGLVFTALFVCLVILVVAKVIG